MKKQVLALLLMTLLLSAILCVTALASDGVELTILHTNDVHGAVEIEPYVAGLAAQLRAEGKQVVVISAGDALDGTSFTNADNGLAMATVMSQVPYDMFILGNHEQNMMRTAAGDVANDLAALNCPILAANASDSMKEVYPGIAPYVVKAFEGVNVAFIGLTTESDETVEYVAVLEEARAAAQAEGATVFVAVTHVGNVDQENAANNSRYLAEQCPWLALIIDSHDHVAYENGLLVDNVLIAEAGSNGDYIGAVTLRIQENGTTSATAGLISREVYQATVSPDEEVSALLAQFREEQAYLNDVICQIPADLDGERSTVRSKESNLGDLVCDAMLWVTDSDFALISGTYLRASVAAGDYTNADRLTTFLSEEGLIAFHITGQEIWTMLEGVVDSYGLGGRGFQQIGGVRLVFDPSQPAGSRLISVTMTSGEPLDLNGTYKYATMAMEAAGGGADRGLVLGENYWTAKPDGTPYGTIPQAFVDYINSGLAGDCQTDGRFAMQANVADGAVWNVGFDCNLQSLSIGSGASVNGAYLTVDGAYERIRENTSYPNGAYLHTSDAYTDVSGWAAGYIYYLTDQGIVNGAYGLFRPQDEITRAELAQMLYRIAGSPETEAADFADVAEDAYYAAAAAWAVEQGIFDRQPGFFPNEPITRQEAFCGLAAFLGLEADSGALARFSDASDVADWAKSGVAALVQLGLVDGTEGRLEPDAPLTRAQAAKLAVLVLLAANAA